MRLPRGIDDEGCQSGIQDEANSSGEVPLGMLGFRLPMEKAVCWDLGAVRDPTATQQPLACASELNGCQAKRVEENQDRHTHMPSESQGADFL